MIPYSPLFVFSIVWDHNGPNISKPRNEMALSSETVFFGYEVGLRSNDSRIVLDNNSI